MADPQSGVLPAASKHAVFLTLELTRARGAGDRVRQVGAKAPPLTRALAQLEPEAGISSVFGLGAAAWQKVLGGDPPDGLQPFPPFEEAAVSAPATPADLLLHVRAERIDLCFQLVRQLRRLFAGAVSVVEEVHAFRYLDSRDLTGFVDGTENPQSEADRRAVALVGEGPFAGGSYVDVQRYVHDLPKWEALSVPEQEQVIARTKAENVEFSAEFKPPTAHIERVSIKEEGKSLEMLRHSLPYGTAEEHGLYFASYTGRPDVFPRMLERMVVADGEGHYDHLLDYSRAVTGARFFAPPEDWLEAEAK